MLKALLAIAAVLAVLSRKTTIWPQTRIGSDMSAMLASFGLLTLLLLLAHEIVSRLTGKRPWSASFLIGALFGCLAGVIGGAIFAYGIAKGTPIPSFVRAVVIATLVGSTLHLLIAANLQLKNRVGRSAQETEFLVLIGVGLLALVTTLIAVRTPALGQLLNTISFGFIDWVGSGTCHSVTSPVVDCEPELDDIKIWQIVVMIAIFLGAELLYLSRRTSLSWDRIALGLAGLAGAGGLIWLALAAGEKLGMEFERRGREFFQSPLNVSVFVLILTGFVGLVLYLLRWVRQKGIAEALTAAFPERDALGALLKSRLGRDLPNGMNMDDVAFRLVQKAEREEWIEGLIVAARFLRPNDKRLTAVAEASGLGIIPPTDADIRRVAKELGLPTDEPPRLQLQRIVQRGGFQDIEDWRAGIEEIERRVCRIEAPINQPQGTGFLVRPDLILTNYHVYEALLKNSGPDFWRNSCCRFDFRRIPQRGKGSSGSVVSEGTVYLFDRQPPLDKSEYAKQEFEQQPVAGEQVPPTANELDYALLRLALPAGDHSSGTSSRIDQATGLEPRGWIELANAPDKVEMNEIIFVVQHPNGEPLKVDIGKILKENKNQTRVYHDANTRGGSSGSPCFSLRQKLAPLALHHAGIGGTDQEAPPSTSVPAGENRAVPFSAIRRLMGERIKSGSTLPDIFSKK